MVDFTALERHAAVLKMAGISDLGEELDTIRAYIAELESALAPFAAVGAAVKTRQLTHPMSTYDDETGWTMCGVWITYAAFTQASNVRPGVFTTTQNDKDGDRGGIAQIAEESVPLKGKK